jgi:hypothetical protein
MHVDDGDTLRRVADRFAEAAVDVLIQQAIPGPESRIESYHAYVDGSGAVAGEFTGRKLRPALDARDAHRGGRQFLADLPLRAKVDGRKSPTAPSTIHRRTRRAPSRPPSV